MDKSVLVAVKTDSSGFPGLAKEESSAFEAELDRLLYTSPSDIEDFARTYIEPGLAGGYGAHTHVGWLNYKSAFQHLREHLPLEWLERFPAMPLSSRNDLFNMAAVAGDRSRLLALISRRSREALAAAPSDDEEIRRQQNATVAFWQLRRFFFEGPGSDAWDALRGDPDTIFAIDDHAGRFGDSRTEGWPLLCAEKIYQILDAYVEVWPHVHLPSSYGNGDPPDERAYRFCRTSSGKSAAVNRKSLCRFSTGSRGTTVSSMSARSSGQSGPRACTSRRSLISAPPSHVRLRRSCCW